MTTRWATFDCFGTLVDWNTGFSAILSPLFGTRTDDVMRAYHAHEREVELDRPHQLRAFEEKQRQAVMIHQSDDYFPPSNKLP